MMIETETQSESPQTKSESPQRRAVESHDSRTGEVWAIFPPTDPAEVAAAVERARTAQKSWAATELRTRAGAVERFRRLLAERKDEMAGLIVRENGKPLNEALLEVLVSAEFARYYARNARRILAARRFRSTMLALWRKRIRIEYEPWGVVGAITPWNYPLLLSSGLVLPALVAGNAVILKPSEYTPSSAIRLGELLREAGIPDDVMQVVPGDAVTGASLLDAGVDKIFLIGSIAAGRSVARRAAETLTPCVLELGGSDPAIVLEDANLEIAAQGIVWSRFTNAGQTCVATKRVYVVEEVYEPFVRAMKRIVEGLEVGYEGNVGALIRPVQHDAITRQYRDALDRGASVAAQAKLELEDPRFFPPTVLRDVTSEMQVLQDETFGPLLPVVRVRDAEEAVGLANATRFGLSASIWSRDTARALELARRLECGTVGINDSIIVAAAPEVPHGGMKQSGIGRSHGEEGLLECVRTKSVVIDRWTGWPEVHWQSGSRRVSDGVRASIDFSHGKGWLARLRAGIRTVKHLYLRRD
jgi:acyl-CoA reductase-like NAD-dependent aldehyde dehydrogenase